MGLHWLEYGFTFTYLGWPYWEFCIPHFNLVAGCLGYFTSVPNQQGLRLGPNAHIWHCITNVVCKPPAANRGVLPLMLPTLSLSLFLSLSVSQSTNKYISPPRLGHKKEINISRRCECSSETPVW